MLLAASAPALSWAAQPVSVVHDKGVLTIACTNAPLSSVFESIRSEAGVELILEDEVKSTRLTANLTEVPVAMAIQRLLEGTGVSYIVMMDPSDWGRVGKVFVGGSGGETSRTARAPRRPVQSLPEPETGDFEEAMESGDEEAFEDATQALDAIDAAIDPSNMAGVDPNMENPAFETPPEDPGDFGDQGEFANPPGSSPIPDYLPPTQAFPRSNFTPGLPNGNNRRTQGGTPTTPEQSPQNPPAAYPFTDPFGRPIPVPPGMTNPQQQQQQRKQQQQQQ
jgi:hypothetical protein